MLILTRTDEATDNTLLGLTGHVSTAMPLVDRSSVKAEKSLVLCCIRWGASERTGRVERARKYSLRKGNTVFRCYDFSSCVTTFQMIPLYLSTWAFPGGVIIGAQLPGPSAGLTIVANCNNCYGPRGLLE